MTEEITDKKGSKIMFWGGWLLSVLPALMLFASASMKFMRPADFSESMKHLGWNEDTMMYIGIVEIVCTVLYLFPKTAVLGAILIAAYLGGATATHVRVGDPFFIPVLLGIVMWLGLWLRDKRLRELLPFVT